jgi:hypothetical protein
VKAVLKCFFLVAFFLVSNLYSMNNNNSIDEALSREEISKIFEQMNVFIPKDQTDEEVVNAFEWLNAGVVLLEHLQEMFPKQVNNSNLSATNNQSADSEYGDIFLDTGIVPLYKEEQESLSNYLNNPLFKKNEGCVGSFLDEHESFIKFQELCRKYFDFSKNQALFKVDDLSGFVDSIEAINFSLGLFLKNRTVSTQSSFVRLNLTFCMIQYWNMLKTGMEYAFEADFSEENHLNDVLLNLCNCLTLGVNECASLSSSSPCYASAEQLWTCFLETLFGFMDKILLWRDNEKNINEMPRVIQSIVCIPLFCASQLIFCSDISLDIKELYYNELTRLTQDFIFHVNSSAIDRIALLENFKKDVLFIHKTCFPGSNE